MREYDLLTLQAQHPEMQESELILFALDTKIAKWVGNLQLTESNDFGDKTPAQQAEARAQIAACNVIQHQIKSLVEALPSLRPPPDQGD